MEDGPQKVIKMANALGVPRNAPGLKPFPAVALGSATVSPIDMANSYATIANGGVHHDWFTVKKVTRASDDKVLYKAPQKTNRVLSEDIASDVSYALQQTVQNGTGHDRPGLGRPAAAKTGTATNDDEDVSSSWFVGYTPQVSTAVMYVRGKGNEALNGYLPSFYGGDYPADTWTAVMELLMEGVEEEEFPPACLRRRRGAGDGHAPYTPPPPKPTKKPKKPSKRQADDPTDARRPATAAEPAAAEPSRRRRTDARAPTVEPAGGQGDPSCDPADPDCAVTRLRPPASRPVRAHDERGDRRAGGPARPAAPVVGAGARAAGAVRGGASRSRWCSTSRA